MEENWIQVTGVRIEKEQSPINPGVITRRLTIPVAESSGMKHGLARVSNVVISINVKRENDGGEADAISTHVNGTPVTFNKPFKDIESITATVKSLTGEPFTTIVDFNDIPNPWGFTVRVYDTSGLRVSKRIEWKVRGIV